MEYISTAVVKIVVIFIIIQDVIIIQKFWKVTLLYLFPKRLFNVQISEFSSCETRFIFIYYNFKRVQNQFSFKLTRRVLISVY